MRSGVSMKWPGQARSVQGVLSLFVLMQLCLSAPGQPGSQREESVDGRPPAAELANPFGSGEENRRLLQSFIESSLKDDQGRPELSTWEQEVFFLFRLFDYDRTGFLDGLEMMKLLSDYNAHHAPGAEANEQVVSMVDFLLQTQDLNQDGLLAPSEVLSPPLPHTQDASNNNAPQQEQEQERAPPSNDEVVTPGAQEQEEQAHEELQHQEEKQVHQEVRVPEEDTKEEDEQHRQPPPEVPAAEHEPEHEVPVHQGQPEI